MNIVLTGFMASGKSVTGRRIAEICGMNFADTDVMVEKKFGMTISEMFAGFGEEYFRKAESDAIETVSKMDGVVISTGGGAVLNTKNIDMLRKNGIIVNLSPDENVIRIRLSGRDSTRPLANGSSMEEILERYAARQPYYNNCDIKISVTAEMSVEDTVKKILDTLEEKYESNFRSGR